MHSVQDSVASSLDIELIWADTLQTNKQTNNIAHSIHMNHIRDDVINIV